MRMIYLPCKPFHINWNETCPYERGLSNNALWPHVTSGISHRQPPPCTTLTAGKCLPLGLFRETGEKSNGRLSKMITALLTIFANAWELKCRADSRFTPSQWETALLCNDVSHWLGAILESTPKCFTIIGPHGIYFLFLFLFQIYLYRVNHSVTLFFHGALLQSKTHKHKNTYIHIHKYKSYIKASISW